MTFYRIEGGQPLCGFNWWCHSDHMWYIGILISDCSTAASLSIYRICNRQKKMIRALRTKRKKTIYKTLLLVPWAEFHCSCRAQKSRQRSHYNYFFLPWLLYLVTVSLLRARSSPTFRTTDAAEAASNFLSHGINSSFDLTCLQHWHTGINFNLLSFRFKLMF